jgi:hypothetical protein
MQARAEGTLIEILRLREISRSAREIHYAQDDT